MRTVALLGCLLLFGACTTPHKTYQPPSNAKVTASTKKVTDGAAKAHATAREAKNHVVEAQKHADALAVGSLDIEQKLDAIIKAAPPELQPALAAVQVDLKTQLALEDALKLELDGTHKKLDELEQHQVTLDGDIATLKIDQGRYQSDAQTLANDATNEREALITTQKQLIQQRVFSWLWKIGGGLIIVIIIVVIIAWKLGWKFLKL